MLESMRNLGQTGTHKTAGHPSLSQVTIGAEGRGGGLWLKSRGLGQELAGMLAGEGQEQRPGLGWNEEEGDQQPSSSVLQMR